MKHKIILFTTAILLCAGAFAALYLTINKPAPPPQTADTRFDESHRQRMQPDTLIRLAQQAYGDSITINKTSDELTLRWNAGPGEPSAFYNNNESLTDVRRQGFTLRTDGEVLHATFQIYKDGTVQVPNDVLISLLRRISKATSP